MVNGRPAGAAGRRSERAVDAAAGPRAEGLGVEEGAGGGDALGDERDGGEPAALAARDGDVGDRLVEPEVVGPKAAHLRGAHPGPVHQLQPDAGHRAGLELGEDGGDVPAVDPARLRGRGCEADEVEQVERRAAAVEDADEVRERVPAVVAGRGGERVAPLVELRIERGQVRRERERAEVAEPGQPRPQLPLAVVEGDQRAADLIEVAAGVVAEGVALAFGERPQAGAQLVAARPDGLERGAGREADLALDAVDLDGGGEPVAVAVDALGDADAAAGGLRRPEPRADGGRDAQPAGGAPGQPLRGVGLHRLGAVRSGLVGPGAVADDDAVVRHGVAGSGPAVGDAGHGWPDASRGAAVRHGWPVRG